MSEDLPPISKVYQDQLTTLSHGLALWDPNPPKEIYDKVSIGDVGYLHEGSFIRMFNVMLSWSHESNRTLGEPEPYRSLDCGPFANTIKRRFDRVNHYSRHVLAESNAGNGQAMAPNDAEGITYKFRNRGELLSLPNGGLHEDIIRAQAFEEYIKNHVDTWFAWAQKNRLGVERVEDLILVSGCTLVTSWAAAALADDTTDAEIRLASRTFNNCGASFVWSNIRGRVSYHNNLFEPLSGEQNSNMIRDQCVFIRGFRVKDDKMQVIRVSCVSGNDDPNVGVVDTIEPPTNNEYYSIHPQWSPYRHATLQSDIGSSFSGDDSESQFGGSSSSLDTIGPLISFGNPYPSSTTIQTNGSRFTGSLMTSPSITSSTDTIVDREKSLIDTEVRLPTSLFHGNSHVPFNIYREQLSSQYFGLALWNPNPVESLFKDPGHVSIGDVGYLDSGTFMRIFNVKLPRDHPSNTIIEIPEGYKPLEREHFDDVRFSEVRQKAFHVHLSKVDNIRANARDEATGQMYECRAGCQGALLSLPHGARSEDVVRTKVFEGYIRDNVDSWLRWSKEEGLPVENTEDLILVTGCTLAKSWAAAAFDGTMSRGEDATAISLEVRKSDDGGAEFVWRNIRGSVEYHNSRFDPNVQEPSQNQCVFIRGFRARRSFGSIRLRAAAEPRPDDPDDCLEDEIQVIRIPDSSESCDPLVGVQDNAVQKYYEEITMAEDIIAVAQDDDIQLMEDVPCSSQLANVGVCEKLMPLVVENGVTISSRPAEYEPPVSEKKQVFELNGEQVPLAINPASLSYNFKLDFFDLPKEIFTSAAYYPLMLSAYRSWKVTWRLPLTLETSVLPVKPYYGRCVMSRECPFPDANQVNWASKSVLGLKSSYCHRQTVTRPVTGVHCSNGSRRIASDYGTVGTKFAPEAIVTAN